MALFTDSKPHFDTLDGLRGIAALVVIFYHLYECFSASPVSHGYFAVDFFFVLSGFVIGYAYDDRWQKGFTVGQFLRRRLIRLHPMVLIGAIIGAITFIANGSERWDGSHVGIGFVMLAMLCTMLMVPAMPGSAYDVRGNTEIFPLNGPTWSLFFEYIGNVLYVLLLRRLSTLLLGLLAVLTGAGLLTVALLNGHTAFGWSFADGGFWLGLLHMLFPYTVGMWMARVFRLRPVRGAFWWCALAIVLVACVPPLGGETSLWHNGLFEAVCILFLFPLLVWLGASDATTSRPMQLACRTLGNLSYPLYLVHYPFMYLFYAYIGFDGDLVPVERMSEVWPVGLVVIAGCLALAWLLLQFYDIPVRRWLSKRL